MAKSKSNVPTINPPSGGMMAWLQQNDPASTASPVENGKPEAEPTPTQVDKVESITPSESQAASQPEEEKLREVVSENKEEPNPVSGDITQPTSPTETNTVVVTQRKTKSRGGEGAKSNSYPETFFKKPAKADGENAELVAKPVRISEEAHWLLSLMVSEARRQGHKLNVGDLIDNLLADHRIVHKSEVDALVASWKTRKRFE